LSDNNPVSVKDSEEEVLLADHPGKRSSGAMPLSGIGRGVPGESNRTCALRRALQVDGRRRRIGVQQDLQQLAVARRERQSMV